MAGSIKDRYGSRLTKVQQAPPKPYWRVVNILKKLHLRFKEINTGQDDYHITIPDFGVAFHFDRQRPLLGYAGWDIVDVSLAELEINDIKFGENLMWLLISKGYMAYLRNKESGDTRLFQHYIVRQGWGLRIIERRLAFYNNEPRHKFLIEHNRRLRDMSISYILTYYPDFFDYLW